MRARLLLLTAAMAALACFSGPAVPARAGSEPAQSLDDELRESLGAEPLDEFDRELFAPKDETPERPDRRGLKQGIPSVGHSHAPPNGRAKEADELRRQILRELGEAAVPEEENPLLEVARQMRQVEGLIAQTESGPQTQDLQMQIVSSLDELIKQARSCSKMCSPSQSSQKSSSRRQVQQPGKKPKEGRIKPSDKRVTDPAGKPGQAEPRSPTPEEMRELVKSVWGELPEAEREQMLQWMSEGEFLPKYELLLEQYFKRLVEEGDR